METVGKSCRTGGKREHPDMRRTPPSSSPEPKSDDPRSPREQVRPLIDRKVGSPKKIAQAK